MEQRFGNVMLGEINEMLISFIGKDMYLDFCGKVKDEAYNKYLSRLFKEDDKVDLSALSLSDERSVAKFVFEKILPDLQKTYSLSENLCKFMKDFVYSLYDRFTQNGMPILDYCSNFDSFQIQDYSEQAKEKYNSAFGIIETKYESLKKFREKFPNEDTIKNVINAMKSRGDNPKWFILKQLLDELKDDKQITALLIDAYVMINIYNSLHDKVKTNVIVNIQYATNMINNGIQYFFGVHGYKTDESRGNDILKTIEEQCPEAAKFYCNWFRGYLFVAKGELKNAKVYYEKAFAARRFAGCHFEAFIKQAFALSCYHDFNADKVRDSAVDNSKSKSPLSRDAKKYWNYGYTVGVFDRKAEETHLITCYRVEHILTYFGTELFPENSEFYKKLLNEQLLWIVNPDESDFNEEYENLSKLTEKEINTRIRLFGSHPTKNPPTTVALFCIEGCYSDGYLDLAKKFIALLKEWLDNFNLDFSLCSDKGCTIACDAIQQYKNLKLHHFNLEFAELKRIVLRIIDKSNEDSLTRASLQKKRSALQEAIESCNIDIVKAVVEKIKAIDNLRISADEDSPVYYAISRYVTLYRYINDPNFKIQDGNINYNNLDVSGLTKEDKIRNMRYYESDSELSQALDYMRMENSYGAQELWNSELIDIQNICLYLIEQTKDQDGYCKKIKEGNFVTSLLFAAESNNIEICRKLIIHNANPNIYSPTFLERCIRWGSWGVLAMYMEKFPDKAKVGINETDNIFHLPLLKAFLQNFKISNTYTITYFNHVVELFKKCGAIYS